MNETKQPVSLLTITRVAEILGVTPARAEYAVKSRGIVPRALAGRTRLWDLKGLAQIRHAVTAIEARRCDG